MVPCSMSGAMHGVMGPHAWGSTRKSTHGHMHTVHARKVQPLARTWSVECYSQLRMSRGTIRFQLPPDIVSVACSTAHSGD